VVLALVLSDNGPEKTATKPKPGNDACKMMVPAHAGALLGKTGSQDQKQTKVNHVASDGIKTSICAYKQIGATATNGKLAASLTVHSATNNASAKKIKQEFKNVEKQNGQDLGGVYGDTGFWDYDKSEINVLKKNTWYILNFGPLDPGSRTLAQSEKFADLYLGKY
jgi:hypothetical protein